MFEEIFEELCDPALLKALSNCGLLITAFYDHSHRHVYMTHPIECNESEPLCYGR